MSIGGWGGLVSLLRDPHYWAKTEHGVSLGFTDRGQKLTTANGRHSTNATAVASPFAPPAALPLPLSVSHLGETRVRPLVGTQSLSVVLPAYNEAALIASTIHDVIARLAAA